MNNNLYMGLAVMGSQKNHLQDEKNKLQEKIADLEKQKNDQISKIQAQVDMLDKKMLELDKKMNKSKVLAQKQDAQEAKDKEQATAQLNKTGEVKANPNKLTLPVQEEDVAPAIGGGDASTTTASLDASSGASGSGSAKPGWKFYDKIGKVEKRKTPKKKLREFIENVWDSYIVDKDIDNSGE